MNIIDRLCDDWGVAILVKGKHPALDLLDRLNTGDGVPVLAMAEGPIGVLRAMSTRCGRFVLDGDYSLAIAKREGGKFRLHWWIIKGTPS